MSKLWAMLKTQKGLLLLLLCAFCVLAYAFVQTEQVDAHFQRVFLPPEQVTKTGAQGASPDVTELGGATSGDTGRTNGASVDNSGLRELRKSAKEITDTLAGACESCALYAVAQPASISVEDGESLSARLVGMEESYYGVRSFSLSVGRILYPEEFRNGTRVVILSEQLAVALFRYAEPLEREVLIAGEKYRVVGIDKRGKRMGDELNYAAYIPYQAMEKSNLELTTMVYEGIPVKGAGGWSAFQSAAARLGKTGTTISLSKESMNATMPARLLGIACGIALGLFLIGQLNQVFTRLMAQIRRRLVDTYAVKLLWWGLGRGLLLALGYAACALVLAQLFIWLVDPVYTFPEWVPAILVEPKDIQTAFWNVWQTPATAIELRTPELLRLRFYRELTGWASGVSALLIGALWGKVTHRAKKKRVAETEQQAPKEKLK
ncbi:MAG: ABC transporter permease [Clostridia bacterium]